VQDKTESIFEKKKKRNESVQNKNRVDFSVDRAGIGFEGET